MKILEVNEKSLEEFKSFLDVISSKTKFVSGINVVTKAVERNTALLVIIASDVDPVEIVAHLAPLCKAAGIPKVVFPSREELGTISVSSKGRPSSCVAITHLEKKDLEHLKKLVEIL